MKILLTLIVLLYLAQSKVFTKTLNIKQLKKAKWHYLTKFQAAIGQSYFNVSMLFINNKNEESLNTTVPIKLAVYLDSEFDSNDYYFDGCQTEYKPKINSTLQVPIGKDQTPAVYAGKLSQKIRPHVWYFSIMDCDGQISQTFNPKSGSKLQISIHVLNADESEFSNEEKGSLFLVGFLTLVNLVIFWYNLRFTIQDFKKNQEYDWPVIVLTIALTFELLQNLLFFFHLLSYSGNGQGIAAFQLLSEMMQVLSNFILTSLLILISWGWSINYIELDSFDLYIPLGIIVAFLQIMIMGLGKLTDDMHYKFHPYDGWVGWTISFIEIGLFTYFFFGIKNTINKSSPKIKAFGIILGIYGSFYFLGFPILLIVSKFVARYARYQVILIGTNALRLAAILFLTRLFTSKKSGFSQISYKNMSFLDRSKLE